MSVPLFISIDSDRSVATSGIKLVQKVTDQLAIQIYYVDGKPPISIINQTVEQRDINYSNLVALLTSTVSPTAPTIDTVTPSTFDATLGTTPTIDGTNFVSGWQAYLVPTGSAPYASASVITEHSGAVALVNPVYDSDISSRWSSQPWPAIPFATPGISYDVCYVSPDTLLIAWKVNCLACTIDAPTITSPTTMLPSSGAAGATEDYEVLGTNFFFGGTIIAGGNSYATTVLDEGNLTFNYTGDLAAGTYDIQYTGPDGQTVTSIASLVLV